MKRLLIGVLIFGLLFSSCYQNNKESSNVEVNISESSKFSKEKIQEAVNCVKDKFSEFKGCTLTKIWYDEKKSDSFIKGYMTSGKGSQNGVSKENVIVLLSEFKVDSAGGDGSLEPNSTYSDWNWILIKDSKTNKWRVDDWGY